MACRIARPRILRAAMLAGLAATSLAQEGVNATVFGIFGDMTIHDVLSGQPFNGSLPGSDVAWGNAIIRTDSFCPLGQFARIWTLVQNGSTVELAAVSITGAADTVSCVTPFTNVNATWLLGAATQPSGGDCTVLVAGRVGPSASGPWQVGRLSLGKGNCSFFPSAAIDGSYDDEIESSGAFDSAGGPGGQGVAYLQLSKLEDVNGTEEYRTYVVGVDMGVGSVGFCVEDWRDMTGRNLDTMDWDAAQQAIIGIGMNDTGTNDDNGPDRSLVKLTMVINSTGLHSGMQERAAARGDGGSAADGAGLFLHTAQTSPAASCTWTALTQQTDHPIAMGGLSALVPYANSTSGTALVWLGSQPMSTVVDAVYWDTVTGELLDVDTAVCDGGNAPCYIAMGYGPV